ncbi:uncharacterized protein LOC131927523 [Physella acuta]|uniref:uncharacterized protein LOC131927523 n=1 Tax=Physella acuta TaxID=109671 RepID=UPI0027DCAD3B|nr:uncharacterized protein LOC131927523 [Physella acuta]
MNSKHFRNHQPAVPAKHHMKLPKISKLPGQITSHQTSSSGWAGQADDTRSKTSEDGDDDVVDVTKNKSILKHTEYHGPVYKPGARVVGNGRGGRKVPNEESEFDRRITMVVDQKMVLKKKVKTQFDTLGETSKILESIPRGETVLCSKIEIDQLDLEHRLLIREVEQMRKYNEIRFEALLEKRVAYLNSIKLFNNFITDMEKRHSKAQDQIQKLQAERKEMTHLKPKLLYEICVLKEREASKSRQVTQCIPIGKFFDAVIASFGSCFRSSVHVLTRHAALKSNVESQIMRYDSVLGDLEQAHAHLDQLFLDSIETFRQMTNKLAELKRDLRNVQVENTQLAITYESLIVREAEEEKERLGVYSAIHNMAHTLSEFRDYAGFRLQKHKTAAAKLKEIGEIILFYDCLLAELKLEIETRPRVPRKKAPKNVQPTVKLSGETVTTVVSDPVLKNIELLQNRAED